MSNMYDDQARRFIPSLAREWDQFIRSLDCDDDAEPLPKPLAEAPAPKPENARTMHRYSHEEQDAYSDRMRARFGGEW